VRLRSEFEHRILPHAPAAYSLAHWLLRHPQDAEDALQEGILKAFKSFHGYNGGNAQGWLLAIVRNTCLTLMERRRAEGRVVVRAVSAPLQDHQQGTVPDPSPQQDAAIIAEEECRRIRDAVAALPLPFREVLVLREYHDLPYREIADIIGAPVGTVMSRLARARERLAVALSEQNAMAGTGTPL
jgi:RNA polymerase sigma-70 factor, ECF subfamily